MARKTKRKQTESRQENPANTQTPSPVSMSPTVTPQGMPAPAQAPQIAPEVRDELTSIMQELLLKTHELSFEYSTCDCEEIQTCPLAQKAKELFKVVKRLNEMMRKMAPPPKTSYVR